MSIRELLWFAAQINLQRWRFFYARMSIKGRITRLEVNAPEMRLPDRDQQLAENMLEFRDTLDGMSRVTP